MALSNCPGTIYHPFWACVAGRVLVRSYVTRRAPIGRMQPINWLSAGGRSGSPYSPHCSAGYHRAPFVRPRQMTCPSFRRCDSSDRTVPLGTSGRTCCRSARREPVLRLSRMCFSSSSILVLRSRPRLLVYLPLSPRNSWNLRERMYRTPRPRPTRSNIPLSTSLAAVGFRLSGSRAPGTRYQPQRSLPC